ncbi:MAG: Threonylcarbamoyladenosine tRNA methylthiotransferase MtaB [Syntrophomonadaceae bacterium]|nr:Threonylcarbamoyladenosine tRNA methylthiotransferase MtaB [Bacillota bacterium]
MKTVAFQTLGCKVNQTETAALQELFARAGYQTVAFAACADVYVINTCTVTHLSDRKSRQLIRRARRSNPKGLIVVTGCLAQVAPAEVLRLPEVDLVIGTHARERLPELVLDAKKNRANLVVPLDKKSGFEKLPVSQGGERTRAFLKVQEGCQQFCSYCIVPYARGPLCSMPPAEAVTEAELLAAQGYKELVLTGINLGSYGLDLPGQTALLGDLLKELARVEGITRIRLSSIEPTEITPHLVELLLSCRKICRHLHIPLQSGNDEILRRMNRRYNASEFLYLVRWLRSEIPGLALTTDVMAGFPGETEENFAHTLELVRLCGFSRLHIFKYSPRRGTPAAGFPDQVPPAVKEERSKRLRELGDRLAVTFQAGFIGKRVEVLFEEQSGHGRLAGLTEHYLRVTAKVPEISLGKLAEVHVLGLQREGLYGETVGA